MDLRTTLVGLIPLLALLSACDEGRRIRACADSTDSPVECQLCCQREGCDPERIRYEEEDRRACTCFPLPGVEIDETACL